MEFVGAFEKDEGKKNFIHMHFGEVPVFKDMMSIHTGQGLVWDKGEEMVEIPACDWWIVGLECDSISPCNPNAKNNRNCGESKSEKTGRTMDAAMKYLEVEEPTWATFEIVKQVMIKPKEDGGHSVPNND